MTENRHKNPLMTSGKKFHLAYCCREKASLCAKRYKEIDGTYIYIYILEANDSPVPRPMAVHARKAVPGKVRSGNDGRAAGRSVLPVQL